MAQGNASASARNLSVNLDKWLEQSLEAARLKFIDVCLEAAEGVVDRTPVDTGFCRAMWSVSIGQEPPPKPVKAPETPHQIGAAAAKAQAVARITAPLLGLAGIEQKVWIYNPVVYAPALENGHSKQAPQGMVAVTVASLRVKYAR